MKYNDTTMHELMQKYNVTSDQITHVIEKIYTKMFQETYKTNEIYARITNNGIQIYDKNNNEMEMPASTSDMIFNLKRDLISELVHLQQLNEYEEFKDKQGQLFQVKITNIINNKLIVNLFHKYSGEITMPLNVNIRDFRIGSYIYALLDQVYNNANHDVENTNYGRQLVFENISTNFMYALAKHFIPHIQNDIIKVTNIVRIPTKRTKFVVTSTNSTINAASICIGKNGEITKKMFEGLNGEYIDFVNEEYDLESKIRSYCKPFHILHIKILNDNAVKVVVSDKDEPNLHKLINKINITLITRLLFAPNQKVQLTFKTESEYGQEIQASQMQLYQLLTNEGISTNAAEQIVNKFLELNDLIFVLGLDLNEEDAKLLQQITQVRKQNMLNEFLEKGGSSQFFEYSIYKFTKDEFSRLLLNGIYSFEEITKRTSIELAQILNVDISFTTILLQEIKRLYY